jgi:hypothetical protein
MGPYGEKNNSDEDDRLQGLAGLDQFSRKF